MRTSLSPALPLQALAHSGGAVVALAPTAAIVLHEGTTHSVLLA
jgi:hypothetical protein